MRNMNIVIFSRNDIRAKYLKQEIIDKLGRLIKLETFDNGLIPIIEIGDIMISIRPADITKTGGLKPDYYLLDDSCSYEFCEQINRLKRKGNEELYSMRHLIMKVIETILYGEED